MSFCSTIENLGNTNCKWPRGHVITWGVERGLPQFSDAEYLEICKMAWQPWEANSGVRTLWQPSVANVNCLFTTKRIDGQYGVLAQAELPCGNVNNNTQLKLWMDTGDQWANAENPPGRVIDVLRVMIHEIGHLLGIGHITGEPAIMNPSISDIRTLTDADIEESTERYGDPAETPGPTTGGCLLSQMVESYIKKVING